MFLTLFPSFCEQMDYTIEFILKSTFQKYIILYRLYPFTSCTSLVRPGKCFSNGRFFANCVQIFRFQIEFKYTYGVILFTH